MRHFLILLAILVGFSTLMPSPLLAQTRVEKLITLLESDPDHNVRERAAETIGEMKASAIEALPALVNAAQHDKWPDVQQAALTAIGEMREAARDAIPVLYAALEDGNGHTRVAARNALFRVDPENKAKTVEIADARAAAPPVGGASAHLFDDISGLPKVLTAELPVAVTLVIYEDFALITAEEPTSSTGWGGFTYRGGAISDLKEARPSCKKTLRFADVDLTLVPRLIKDSLQRAGGAAKVNHVSLSRGVFCKKVGWQIFMENGERASRIEYKLNGKLKKVWP